MSKYYLRTEDRLRELISEEKIPEHAEGMIKARLNKVIGSRFLLVEVTPNNLIKNISDVDSSEIPLNLMSEKEIDSAMYL
jgi:hypothetical protein